MKSVDRRKIRFVIAILLGVMFAGVMLALIFVEMPLGNNTVMNVLVGFLGGAFSVMVSFYFGDSEGKDVSEVRDE